MTRACRVVPLAWAEGALNMARDEVLLRGVRDRAAFRTYGWSRPTVSLGYFQPASVRLAEAPLRGLDWVRRPSGGATLVHDRELTYALAVPPGREWTAEPWMPRVHRIIAAALARLGVAVQAADAAARHGQVLCYQQFTPGDLLCRGHKVVGSAQRKHRLATMQHGSILLERSPHAPQLPGIRELAGVALSAEAVAEVLLQEFERDTGWALAVQDWREDENAEAAILVREKYGHPSWNERR